MTSITEFSKTKRSEPMKKRIPVKRSVSFAKINQYHSAAVTSHGVDDDEVLQCRDKRRRYQRRGSKTPAMLLLTKSDLSRIQEKFFPSDSATTANTAINAAVKLLATDSNNNNENIRTDSIQQRRMSLISSLRQNLELNCSMLVGGGGGSNRSIGGSEKTQSTTATTSVVNSSTPTAAIRRRLSLDLTMQTTCSLSWGL